MRFSDLEIVIDVVIETDKSEAPRGVRSEIAKRRGIGRSIVTDAIRRVEKKMAVALFESDSVTLTRSGRAMADHGPRFIETKRIFLEFVQKGRRPIRSENPNDEESH
jgi:Mn-dependent DtxR family transcriptional regulator